MLLIIFLIVEVFINPIGEFCLNDDWAYAASVKEFLNSGTFDIGSWPAMTLLVHVLWGSFFVKVFGFSFTILRFSVLVLSFITLLVTQKLIFKLTNHQWYAFIISLLLLFNPLFLCLSNSYMTDVSFLCFFLLSIYFFYCFYEKEQMKYLIAGFCASLLAVFIRQLGMVVPFSFCLVALFSSIYYKKWKSSFFISWLLLVAILGLLFLFERYISATFHEGHSFQGLFFSKKTIETSFIKTMEHFYVRLGLMLLYSGLFLFPVLISDGRNIWWKLKSSSLLSKLIMTVFALLILFVFHYFPCGNYLYNMGVGLETTIDVMKLDQNKEHSSFNALFILVSMISVLGNMALIILLFSFSGSVSHVKQIMARSPFLTFLCFTLCLYQILITFSSSFFDRYSLCFFVLCLMIIVFKHIEKVQFSKWTLLALLFYAMIFSVCVKDYFNYNTTKAKLVKDLESSEHIVPGNINGGFEYMMWHSYASDRISRWQDDYKPYLISFSPIDKYHKVQYSAYQRYIPYKMDTIFVLQKDVP
ncbi:MAG: glycosyltransferase family 39 protein [Bacteroidetes bacterium]|nr:glycosyltransferase family 39 protein [Bacteroidota bacterium]